MVQKVEVGGPGDFSACETVEAVVDDLLKYSLNPSYLLEWSNSEINTTGRNDVPAEPVRIEVRRWLRTGGLRATPGHYRRNFASENNDYRK
jgi:hypothetical protein